MTRRKPDATTSEVLTRALAGESLTTRDTNILLSYNLDYIFRTFDGGNSWRMLGRSEPILHKDESLALIISKELEGTFYWEVLLEGAELVRGSEATITEAVRKGGAAIELEYFKREPVRETPREPDAIDIVEHFSQLAPELLVPEPLAPPVPQNNEPTFELFGEHLTLDEMSDISGIQRATLEHRTKIQWTPEKVVFTPVRQKPRRPGTPVDEGTEVLLQQLCAGLRLTQDYTCQRGRAPLMAIPDYMHCLLSMIIEGVSSRVFKKSLAAACAKGKIPTVPHTNGVVRWLTFSSLTPILHAMIDDTTRPFQGIEMSSFDSVTFSTNSYVSRFNSTRNRDVKEPLRVHAQARVGLVSNIISNIEVASADPVGTPTKALPPEMRQLAFVEYRPLSSWGDIEQLFHSRYKSGSQTASEPTTMGVLKTRFGETLRTRSPVGRMNEVLCRVLCHNLFVLSDTLKTIYP